MNYSFGNIYKTNLEDVYNAYDNYQKLQKIKRDVQQVPSYHNWLNQNIEFDDNYCIIKHISSIIHMNSLVYVHETFYKSNPRWYELDINFSLEYTKDFNPTKTTGIFQYSEIIFKIILPSYNNAITPYIKANMFGSYDVYDIEYILSLLVFVSHCFKRSVIEFMHDEMPVNLEIDPVTFNVHIFLDVILPNPKIFSNIVCSNINNLLCNLYSIPIELMFDDERHSSLYNMATVVLNHLSKNGPERCLFRF